MSAPRRMSRTLYVFILGLSVVFTVLELVVAVWGAARGEPAGHVAAALVRVVPFVALGLLARRLYAGTGA